jgi:hypothetical protein
MNIMSKWRGTGGSARGKVNRTDMTIKYMFNILVLYYMSKLILSLLKGCIGFLKVLASYVDGLLR